MYSWQLLKSNPNLWSRYLVKQEMLRAIRAFFEELGYNEMESPILSPALPSERYLNFLSTKVGDRELYLIPSTERYNKIGLAAGIGQHFVVTKVFRGMEQVGPNHRPEFTMLEWYHLDGTYFDLMDDTEQLVQAMLKKLGHTDFKISYQGKEIDFSSPWDRYSVNDLLQKHADIELREIMDWQQLKDLVISSGLLNDSNVTEDKMSWQDMFELLFFNKVEENLSPNKPTFIYDYPKVLAPLAAPHPDNELVSQKVELYVAGKEIANGYTELRDAALLKANLEEEYTARKQLGLLLAPFDNELIAALESGLPAVAGIGMGLDRLAMIFADVKNISDINLFSID